MRLTPPPCCKLLRQVPTFFIITKRLEALESRWEKDREKDRGKENKNQEHTAAAMQAKSADQQSHQLSLEIFLLHFGLPYFILMHTSTPEKFAMLKSPILEKGYILAVPTICNLPAVQGLLLPVLRAGWKSLNAMGSKGHPLQGNQPFCKAHCISSGLVPY